MDEQQKASAKKIRELLIGAAIWRGDTLGMKFKSGKELYLAADDLLNLCDAVDPPFPFPTKCE